MPPFGGNPWWVYLASALPALLVTILVFMDQQITAVIVNRKEHKLKVKRGEGEKNLCLEGGAFRNDKPLCSFDTFRAHSVDVFYVSKEAEALEPFLVESLLLLLFFSIFLFLLPDLCEVRISLCFSQHTFSLYRALATFTPQLHIVVILLVGVRDVAGWCLDTVQLRKQTFRESLLKLSKDFFF